jgi:hypothetical protein
MPGEYQRVERGRQFISICGKHDARFIATDKVLTEIFLLLPPSPPYALAKGFSIFMTTCMSIWSTGSLLR